MKFVFPPPDANTKPVKLLLFTVMKKKVSLLIHRGAC